MIVKSFELNKKPLQKFKYFLLYGNNRGYIKESLQEIINQLKKAHIYNYEENEIIKNFDHFYETISVKSFFENERIIIINRATDKIKEIIEDLIEKDHDEISIIVISNSLEKKSKLRSFFEKRKETIIVPFYEDNLQTLNNLAINFLKQKKISLSQQNVNLILERCGGDRINLYNELEKIDNFSKNGKKIETQDILKLTNLSGNFNANELVDNALAKNQKKTIYILNENTLLLEDSILIIRIFINKLKKLLKIINQIENEKNKNIDYIISSFKPPIFWKEKDIIKTQIKNLNFSKINQLLIDANKTELTIKKNPTISTNIITNFILEQTI